MVRDGERLSPPHALPRWSAATLAPSITRLRARFSASRGGGTPWAFAVCAALALFSACGRSELITLAQDDAALAEFEIDLSRELTLSDDQVVLVELVAPAVPEARVAVIELEDGVALEEVVAAICPDGDPELVLDTTGSNPEMRVYRDGELLGLIWL